jgi:hypothetical protein
MSWRDHIEVHPAADLFPMMSDAELDELAKDILKAKGLTSPIILWGGLDSPVVLDGRNRLAAIARIGGDQEAALRQGYLLDESTDPYAYVISANIHRRHLKAEGKREVIAKLLKADPKTSDLTDRQIAKIIGCGHPLVAEVRKTNGIMFHKTERVEASGRKARGRKPGTAASPKPIAVYDVDPSEDKPVSADGDWSIADDDPMLAAAVASYKALKPRQRQMFQSLMGLGLLKDYDAIRLHVNQQQQRAETAEKELLASEPSEKPMKFHLADDPQEKPVVEVGKEPTPKRLDVWVNAFRTWPQAASTTRQESTVAGKATSQAKTAATMAATYAALNPGHRTTARGWVREGCQAQWEMFELYPPLRPALTDFIAAAEASSPEDRQAWLAGISPGWETAKAAAE